MLLGVIAQAQNFAITATTEAAVRKNIVKGNAANFGFGMINDTLKLIGLTTRNVIFTGTIGKSGVGLGNVDNTSDANKPVSTATQTALNLKANLASPAFTGTVSGITKTMVGLGNVDNTTDISKPISTATQTALDLKLTTSTAASTYLPISNPTATGTLTAPTIANSLGATFATTSGNVGVGTSSALAKLDIRGDIHVSNGSGIKTRYRTGGVIDFTNFAESAYADAAITGNTLSLFGNNGTGLYVNSSGNVGIGTTAPVFGLDIRSVNQYGRPSFGGASADATRWGYFLNPINSGQFFDLMRSNNVDFRILTESTIGGGAALQLIVKSTGNVGIGTDSPTSKLHVYLPSAFNRMQIENTGNFQNGLRLNRTGGDYATDWEIYTPSNSTALNFYNGANRMTMFANGNIGVGTTTDGGDKLQVNGNINIANSSALRFGSGFQFITNTAATSRLDFGSNGIANMSIVDGNVGIGTTTPISKLDVTGAIFSNVNNNNVYILNSTGSNYGFISNNGNNIWSLGYGTNIGTLATPALSWNASGNVGIGTTASAASAILDITSTTQGVLFPRMTTTQITNITSPANGLTVYNTTLAVLCFYDGTGWKKVSHLSM
jgi:hypothetical protein